MIEQSILFIVIFLAMSFFIWGKIRYEIVALSSLFVLALTGVIPIDQVFSGFSHPALIIVVSVLILSKGLLNSGLVDRVGRGLSVFDGKPIVQVFALTLASTILSAFIYNVGALAILMPVAIRMAHRSKVSPAMFLMPIAFGTHLGGFLTLISAIPNIIVATFRQEIGLEPFAMFDFAKVGIWLALVGVIYIAFVGWRLLPKHKRKEEHEELFHIKDYITELRVTSASKVLNKSLREVLESTKKKITIAALIRNEHKISAPSEYEILREHDVLLVRADEESIKEFMDIAHLELIGSHDLERNTFDTSEAGLMEVVVSADSLIKGETAFSLNLRWQYGVNLLALSRHDKHMKERLDDIEFKPGDILLLQGENEKILSFMSEKKLLPLAEREVSLGRPHKVIFALSIFALAVFAATTGFLPIEIVFSLAALSVVLTGLINVKEAYQSIDWPVIVLLGSLIPLGIAIEASGGAQTISSVLMALSAYISPTIILGLVLVASMVLADLVNTAGSTILMAPIAILIAQGLGVSIDPFLMAVAIGGSCAFMTPIGHQSNTLVMRPGGYKFGDYWRMGLPLNILIIIISIPLILKFWPF